MKPQKGESREFMSVVGVQEHLEMIWRGNISLDQSYLEVFVCLALSPILWFLPSMLIKSRFWHNLPLT